MLLVLGGSSRGLVLVAYPCCLTNETRTFSMLDFKRSIHRSSGFDALEILILAKLIEKT